MFTVLCLATPFVSLVAASNPGNPAGQIANMHTIFNIATTVVLIPFGTMLANLAEKLLPDQGEEQSGQCLQYIPHSVNVQDDNLGISAITIYNARLEIRRMLEMAIKNVELSFEAFQNVNVKLLPEIDEREDYIDFLNKEISKYISRVIVHERTEEGGRIFNSFYKITSNIERIGDHAVNIAGYSKMLKEKNVQLTEHTLEEVEQMKKVCHRLFAHLTNDNASMLDEYQRVASLEQKIDDMTEGFRNEMMKRVQKGICSDEGSILFAEMVTDFERIGDHALNISRELTRIRMLSE
jgi:phosphate:Na+ symporter